MGSIACNARSRGFYDAFEYVRGGVSTCEGEREGEGGGREGG